MDWTVIKILAFLCAFTVFCTGQGQGGLVNVALGKNCSQSSYYNGNSNLYPAGNAANGNTGHVFDTDNCIHTDNLNAGDYNPWWEVDLGKIYPVYGITIYARNGQGFRLTNTQITVDGAECYSIGKMSPPDVYTFNCTNILYGQKVLISRTYTNPDYSLNMCEFQVFVPYDVSVCGVGWHGNSCTLQCSANCGGGPGKNPCHRDTGACFYGCLNNQYRGDQCNQPCDSSCKDAVCKQDTGACLRCEAGTYGNYCAKQCDPRCQGNICNRETGSCLLNVALNQAASMSSQDTNSGPASNAVNGNTDSNGNLYADNCIVTGNIDTAPWWQVDLGRKYPVHSITSSAMLRRQQDLVASTITVDGSRCYRYYYQFPTRTTTFSCDSAVYGQVIRINRDNRARDFRLSLCEFQVWVCTSGFFGDTCDGRCNVIQCAYCDQMTGTACYECNAGRYNTDCSMPCIATTCKDNQCDRQTGLCTQCNGNFGGVNCTDCAPGFYGQVCIQQCRSPNCLNNACNRTHGWCDACPPGYFGLNCDQSCSRYCKDNQCALTSGRCLSCPVRYWGGSCDQECSTGCDGTRNCDQETGDCLSCASRRWGSKCDKECPSGCGGFGQCDARTGLCLSCPAGSWENFCNNTCLSDRCKDNICNMTTGLCVECRGPNFQLPYCECKDNYYYLSPFCFECPGRCFNNTPCNKTNGYCYKCPPGIAGRSCNQGCPKGTYGQDCAEKCGQCTRNEVTCNAVTGHCSACELGWTEPFCQVCVNGRYGVSCSEICGQCSGGATCDKTSGECAACPVGVQPPLCKQNCSKGTYGEGCAKKCGSCSTGVDCHHISGECQGGCARGFTGALCAEQVQDEPEGISMGVIGGAIGGLLVAIIIAVIVVVVIVRRRKRAPKPAYNGVSEEMSGSRNGLNANTNTNGSPLSFEPMIVVPTSIAEAVNPPSKPKAAVRPSVKAKPPRTPRDKGAIYENVATLGQEDRTHPGDAGSPKLPPKDKKGKQPKKSDDDAPYDCLTDDEEAFADNADDSLYANEDMYYNVDPASLSLDSLQRQLLNKLRARDKLDAEFQKIPTSDEKATKTNGEREENYMKNRFNSILPYDRNIVTLDKIDGDDASDYVNASFVRGPKSDKAYIAAQGPKNNTVDAFWRMVWQEHVTHIVMLTNLLEHNKWKCFGYWPAKGGKKTYGPIEVAGVHEEQRAHYVIRTFDVAQSGGKEKRRVQQYHYTSWMDHEVPATTPLVDFWRYIRTRTATDKYPLVVHCSAGVGRTGTFIALDIVIDHAQHETNVSINDVVRRLRDDRCNMVQNKSQYVFLHEAVLEAYTSLGTRLDLNTFDSVFAQPVESGTVHQRVDKEFEALRQMRSCFTRPVYNNATQDDNRDKNRNPNALPDDRHLVFLTPHVKGRKQYINAVYMSTFHEPRGSILTQLPLPDTVMDIWRLVDGCKVSTIVAIGDVHDAGYGCYWPLKAGETVQTGIYTVTFKSSTMLGTNLASYTLSIDLQDQTDTRSVEVLHYEDWHGEVPANTTDLIHLLDTLQSAQSDRKGNPFLVQCIDGAAKSGLFCALYDVKCRMTQDEEVDVYLAVRRVQSVRPEAVPSVEQYRYCYELIQHYRNSQNVYANA